MSDELLPMHRSNRSDESVISEHDAMSTAASWSSDSKFAICMSVSETVYAFETLKPPTFSPFPATTRAPSIVTLPRFAFDRLYTIIAGDVPLIETNSLFEISSPDIDPTHSTQLPPFSCSPTNDTPVNCMYPSVIFTAETSISTLAPSEMMKLRNTLSVSDMAIIQVSASLSFPTDCDHDRDPVKVDPEELYRD
ncbi:hypothetical protein BLNAU_22399 [Blattamonas nauphoetae]|uniref:Uncharacterized protein n=1 Tax=Blattamonas nauphoetae TaxID=2049346 RepID=A0ABQ9WTM3_9EUKA|nr:hypothetical protein BLNAU_22399 [Blattamonas nauphoetae]